MFTTLAVIYVFICLFLILVVLLQAGRGGGMGAAFGGSTQTVFGGAGAGNFLTKLTVACAALFMVLSATLSYLSSGHGKNALEEAAQKTQATIDAKKKAEEKKKAAAVKQAAEEAAGPMSSPETAADEAAPLDEPAPEAPKTE
ncbi:MAG: preprotein translocase subunit SecG [Myxococcales bacterium]|nr:MAG: preprotein translocase subunit SecG [Myxococcales bacterium]